MTELTTGQIDDIKDKLIYWWKGVGDGLEYTQEGLRDVLRGAKDTIERLEIERNQAHVMIAKLQYKMEWQPIETAPKDELIIVWAMDERVYQARWVGEWVAMGENGWFIVQPIRWHPTPQAPVIPPYERTPSPQHLRPKKGNVKWQH